MNDQSYINIYIKSDLNNSDRMYKVFIRISGTGISRITFNKSPDMKRKIRICGRYVYVCVCMYVQVTPHACFLFYMYESMRDRLEAFAIERDSNI